MTNTIRKIIPYVWLLLLPACYYQGHENKSSTEVQSLYDAHAENGIVHTDEDTPVTGKLKGQYLATTFTYVVTQLPKKGTMVLDAVSGKFTYTPTFNANGEDSFTFVTVGKDGVRSKAAVQKVIVAAVNDAPQGFGNELTTNEDTLATGSLTASDAEGEGVTYTVVSQPANGSINLNRTTGDYTFSPNANFNGADNFQFLVSDGKKDSIVTTININVRSINDAPVVAAITVNEPEDSGPIMRTIVVTDIDSPASALRFSERSHSRPDLGSLTLNQNGSFSYVPAANANGTDTFTYQVSDGFANSNIAMGTINLGAINDAPVAQNRTETTLEDTSLIDARMRANDVDGDPLTYRITQAPSNGTLTPNLMTGFFTYRPNANFNGSDLFRFVARDGSVDSNEAMVTVNVTAVNDAPAVGNLTLNIEEEQAINGIIVGTDIETAANQLQFSRVTTGCSGPTKGTVSIDPDGSFTYAPNSNATGQDTFCYRASDGSMNSNTGIATVNIAAVNDAPRSTDLALSVDEDNSLTNRQLTATDVDSNSLTYTIAEAGNATTFSTTNGSVTYNQLTGRFSYTPRANFNGIESFHFRVSDGQLQSNESVVTITVRAVNDRPIAIVPASAFSGSALISGQLQGNDIENGNNVSYGLSLASPNPVNVAISPSGAFTATAPPGFAGPTSFQFVVSDGALDSSPVTVNLNFQ